MGEGEWVDYIIAYRDLGRETDRPELFHAYLIFQQNKQLKRIADALEWQKRVVCLADRYFLLADIVHVNPVFNKNLVFWQFGVKTKAGAIHYSQTFDKVTEAEAARAEFIRLWEVQ